METVERPWLDIRMDPEVSDGNGARSIYLINPPYFGEAVWLPEGFTADDLKAAYAHLVKRAVKVVEQFKKLGISCEAEIIDTSKPEPPSSMDLMGFKWSPHKPAMAYLVTVVPR